MASSGSGAISRHFKELFEDLEGYRSLKHKFGLESSQVLFASLEQVKVAKHISDNVYIREKYWKKMVI